VDTAWHHDRPRVELWLCLCQVSQSYLDGAWQLCILCVT